MLLTLPIFGEEIEVTEALLRVSGGIAAFAGLYYAIAVLTDSTYAASATTRAATGD